MEAIDLSQYPGVPLHGVNFTGDSYQTYIRSVYK